MSLQRYNPLDYDNLARGIVQELLNAGPYELPPTDPFSGEGVYALFYRGDFPLYQRFVSKDAKRPIYVGKASLPGARKGEVPLTKANGLYRRLVEHGESIRAVSNLEVKDFCCRILLLDTMWVSLAEEYLIRNYKPLWNCCLDGFGAHNPGAGRHQGEVSWWDTLHPGRPWAKNLKQSKQQMDAIRRIESFRCKEDA